MEDVLAKAWAQIKWEEDEANSSKFRPRNDQPRKEHKPHTRNERYRADPYSRNPRFDPRDRRLPERPNRKLPEYNLCITPSEAPPKMRTPDNQRDRNKFCDFHNDHGHRTDDCIALRLEVIELLKRGLLADLLTSKGKENWNRRDNHTGTQPIKPPRIDRTLNCITGGSEISGISQSSAKRHCRSLKYTTNVPKEVKPDDQATLSFSSSEVSELSLPHHDALVISLLISNCLIKRTLIDNGSSSNVIFLSTLKGMQVEETDIVKRSTTLIGFSGEHKTTLGEITLPTYIEGLNLLTKFQVIDAPSAYNVIMGRPWIHELRAVPSTYHQIMKFPTPWGVRSVRGEQISSRECYITTFKQKVFIEVNQIEAGSTSSGAEDRSYEEPKVEDLDEIQIHPEHPDHKVSIGSRLTSNIREQLIEFLKEHHDCFAWSFEDMTGIDPSIITHKLQVDPDKTPIKQKIRKFAPERNKIVDEEVDKLLKNGHIREVHYPEWLANVVVVKKKNGKNRLCIDFTDLNQACPKDSFPLPHIDALVDATEGHELMSFMDAFSGYNQILRHHEDQEKTAFITHRGMFCYKVMPFGLKNAGATYQRLVNRMFEELIGITMEVYIDDMLVKSVRAQDHVMHLRRTFEVLRRYNMKLNPTLFSVECSAKLLKSAHQTVKVVNVLIGSKSTRVNSVNHKNKVKIRINCNTKNITQRLKNIIFCEEAMLSKADTRKKIDEISGTGKFAIDLETISKALFADKALPRLPSSPDCCRSEAVGESHLSEPKTNLDKAKDDKKDSVDKEKKPSIWSWRGLKALTHGRNRRFNCCFSLLVHSVEGLPSLFDDVCLVVHWKRRDGEQMTSPVRVHKGVAEFEEQLTHSCSVNVSRSSSHNVAKYEAKHFLLYASVYNAPELDLGKHRIELTRLLPLTLEELEEEKSSGKWTTSFRLSGKATGATMNVSFGYIAEGNNREPSSRNNAPDILSLRQNRAKTETFVDQSDLIKNELSIHRVGSLPARLVTLKESAEDIKDLHEVLPMPTSELYQSVNVLYQKLDEEIPNVSVEDKSDIGLFPSHFDSRKVDSFKHPDSDEKNLETEREIGEFFVTEKGIEEFTKEQVKPEEDPHKVALVSGEALETDGIVEVVNKDDTLPPSAKEIISQKYEQEQSINTCSSTEKENSRLSKELLMIELEMALSYATDLVNEGLDSQDDESEAPFQESSVDSNSQHGELGKGTSPNLDDITDSVANDFLEMLDVEHSTFGMSSESEPDSPRERLLKQFEKDAFANGGILNFDIENDPREVVSDIPTGSVWEAMSNDFYQSSVLEGFREMPKVETDAFRRRAASRLEDLESEALMRDWGLKEKAFQHSPPSKSDGFCSPVDIPPEDLVQLPSLAEGLGPFLQTKNGGFLRSMNPALFRKAKGGGSLIMQASSPVVVPAEMGSGVMDILQGLASVGIEKLSMQANKLMPLEDITGKTIQQITWEVAPSLERAERQGLSQHEFETMQNISNGQKIGIGISSGPELGKSGSTLSGTDTEYMSLEDLAPSAMDKIEALSIEGLRVQSGMTDEDAPSNISTQSIGELSALKGKGLDVGGTMRLDGTGGLQLLDIKDKCDDVDGLMGLSLTLDEWMKLDSGEIDEDDLVSERTSRLLEAHHATSLDLFRGRSKGEKRRGRGRKYGLLGDSFTVALMVQLRDPLRNYEPVGNPMLALIQVERVFVPPRPRISRTVPLAGNASEEEKESTSATNEDIIEKPIEERDHEEELIPQYKINEVHVAGLKVEAGKKKLWGSTNQQQSGSRWLLANGMGKKSKHPLMKSKAVVKKSGPAASPSTATVQPGDTLWSISSRVHGTGAKWKELAALNPHIRNPNVILPNETIRLH
ncbi:hypothetical protein C2S52_019078 [Perilla frutescens var. hirtella]|nr:hypothetical protein C2S52_019078 [Perilla frutescens var. hirtella]